MATAFRKSRGEKVFDAVNHTLLALFGFSTLYPFIYSLVYSLNEGVDASRGGLFFWPRVFTLANYRLLFEDELLLNAFVFSVGRTLVGTFFHLLFTALLAFAFTKKDLPGRAFLTFLFFITTLFSGGLIPKFLLYKTIGIYDTFWVFILPFTYVFFHMIIMRTFMSGIPVTLEESALMDGAGYWRVFISIVVPLSAPVIATIALFMGVFQWNSWFDGLFFVNDRRLMPLQSLMQNMIRSHSMAAAAQEGGGAVDLMEQQVTNESLKMAAVMVATIPIVCVYPFLQRYFVKGVLIGSIKG